MKAALEQHNAGLARVIPILLRPVDLEAMPIHELQGLPTGARPVTEWPSEDAAFVDIAKGIRKVIQDREADPWTPTDGQDVHPVPRGLLAFANGWLGYIRSRALRRAIRRNLSDRCELPHIVQRATDNIRDAFTIPTNRGWVGRPAPTFSRPSLLVIVGFAGTGKTTYWRQMLESYLSHTSTDELLLYLDAEDLALIPRHKPERLWPLLFRSAQASVPRELAPMSQDAVAFAISRRPVLLVVENAHVAGSVLSVFTMINSYLQRYHKGGTYTSIVFTTRESLSTLPGTPHLPPNVELISLRPLMVDPKQGLFEPNDFFLDLCETNSLDFDRLDYTRRHGSELASAFGTGAPTDSRVSDVVRTPLFVVICAWLACRSRSFDSTDVLQMDLCQVFKHFIRELFVRAANKTSQENEYLDFIQKYQSLAIGVWPDEKFDRARAEQLLSRSDISFMAANGFLVSVQTPSVAERLAFPHQSIGDYLAANYMVDKSDFEALRGENEPARLEGISQFIAELTFDAASASSVLKSLAKSGLTPFVSVMTRKPALLSASLTAGRNMDGEGLEHRNSFFGNIATEAVEWANGDLQFHDSAWVALHRTLSSCWRKWNNHFCGCIGNHPSPGSIVAVAAVATNESDSLLKSWLATHQDQFEHATHSQCVQSFLLSQIGEEHQQKQVFGTLAASSDLTLIDQAVIALIESGSTDTEQYITGLIDACKPDIAPQIADAFARVAKSVQTEQRLVIYAGVIAWLWRRYRTNDKVPLDQYRESGQIITALLHAKGLAWFKAFSLAWRSAQRRLKKAAVEALRTHLPNLDAASLSEVIGVGGVTIAGVLIQEAGKAPLAVKRLVSTSVSRSRFGKGLLIPAGTYSFEKDTRHMIHRAFWISTVFRTLPNPGKPDNTTHRKVARHLRGNLPTIEQLNVALVHYGLTSPSLQADCYIALRGRSNAPPFAVFQQSGGLSIRGESITWNNTSASHLNPERQVIFWEITDC